MLTRSFAKPSGHGTPAAPGGDIRRAQEVLPRHGRFWLVRRTPGIRRLSVSFTRLPERERDTSFITCSRAHGTYQFSDTLLKSGPKALKLALVDALAQTKGLAGKCDLDHERELMRMVLDCAGG